MSWGDWGFIDTPEVQHRLAMAWDEWADKIKHRTLNPKNNYYQYEITHPPDKDFGSFLSYNVDHPQKRLDIELLQTHPNFERRGVGEALIRRMHEDYPDYKIVTGPMTNQGKAFHDRLMERVPTAKDWITSRVAMAWDEWANKINHDLPDNVGLYGNQGEYTIDHSPNQQSVLTYSVSPEGPDDNSVFIDNLFTDPDFQRQGVAEAFIRRLHQDYPDHKINPGAMFPDGQAFHDRMLQKEPTARDLVTAANHIVAMAWDEWADKIRHGPVSDLPFKTNHYKYFVDHGEGSDNYPRESFVSYWDQSKRRGFGQKQINIDLLDVHPEFRNRGVAEALIRRIHQDHPDFKIRPGGMTEQGQAFHDKMLEKEPAARDLVTARRLFLAMAWQDWKDKIKGGCDEGCAHNGTYGRYVIPQAGAFLDFSHAWHRGREEPQLWISGIYTHPQNRNDGVAEALMRRLAEDHPGIPIKPGIMTNDGQNFHDRMLEKEPTARDLVM